MFYYIYVYIKENMYFLIFIHLSSITLTRVASHLARSDNSSITCIVACLSCSDTQQCYDAPPANGKAPRAPLASGRRTCTREV